MRLLYIHQYFNFPEQSGGTRSYDLATAFVKKGCEVSVISCNKEYSEEKWSVYKREGITFYMLNCQYNNSMTFCERMKSFLKFMYYSSIKALQINCDCVLATSTPLTIAVPALIRKWVKQTPYIFEVRDVWPEVPIKMGFIKNRLFVTFLYKFEKLVYRNAFAIVPLSTGMEKSIQSRYPNKKSIVIPNISEISRFSDISVKVDIAASIQGRKIVLYAGTLGNVNGLKYVVDLACKTLEINENVVYFLFGNGKEKDEVRRYAKEKRILNINFFLFDAVSKTELPYLYSIATVGSSFVIDNPVLWHNSANKFFDTLASARPVIINHQGWQADAIEKYNIGYVLPAVLTHEKVRAFVEYLNNDLLLNAQSNNALRLAKEEFSLEVAVNRYMMILNEWNTL